MFDKLDDSQFAYTRGRSTEDAIALLQYYVAAGFRACSGASKVAVISLDISKAFDKAPTHSLIEVLREKYGVPDGLSPWIQSYLTDRSQSVVCGTCVSDVAHICPSYSEQDF